MRRILLFLALAAVFVPAGSSSASPRLALAATEAPRSELHAVRATTSFGTTFVRLQQTVGGLPVLGAGAVRSDAPGAHGDLLLDHSRAGIVAEAATVSRADALRAAIEAVGATVFRAEPSASLAILPRGPHGVTVWRAVIPAASPLGSFEVLVDAQTGRILRTRDLLHYATGHAMIFDPNPVEENGGTIGLTDNNDADSPLLTSLRRPVTLERMNGDCLSGQWVNAVLPAGDPDASDSHGNVCAPGTRNFDSITRSNDKFEALMAYFHIDRTQAYIESLGFTNVVNRPLKATADADVGDGSPGSDDNSYYDPATKEISFGPGGVDDAEEADVIVHEYGHAVQDSQVPGFGEGEDAGSMGEGFGDYLQADMSATYTPNPVWDPCMGEWDMTALGGGCLRRVDSTQTVAQLKASCGGDVHCIGEAWSAALWKIRGALGGPAADRLIIQSQFALPANASFEDGSRALLSADRQLYGGSNQALLKSVLSNQGLLDLEHLDDAPDGATPLAVPGEATGQLDATSDTHDVYSLALAAGHGVLVKLSGAGDFDLRLFAPGTTSVFTGALVGGSTTPGTATESFAYVPPSGGTYYLDVSAVDGAGPYTVQTISDLDGDSVPDGGDNCPTAANRDQKDTDGDHIGDACDRFPRDAANDVDHDGIGANADNCPKISNANQRDWNHNGRGDACDRSSRITISAVSVRGHNVTLVGSVRPVSVGLSTWSVFVQRSAICPATTCRFTRAVEKTGARKLVNGRIQFKFNLSRPGRYRVFATLADPRFKRAKSRVATIRIR